MSNGSGPPTCAATKASAPTSVSLWSVVGLVASFIFGPLVLAGFLHAVGFSSYIVPLLTALGVDLTGATSFALAAYAGIALAAVVAAVAISVWAWSNYSNLSSAPTAGTFACIAGVIDKLQPADNGSVSGPFSLAHGFIQVVLKSSSWKWASFGSQTYIWCETCQNCPPSIWPGGTNPSNAGTVGCSAMLPCIYRSKSVVAAGLGEAIGATVGAAVGAALGIIAGIAAMGALGCAATVVFSWICLVVLLVAILIALAVVAVVALFGAAMGQAIGTATTPDDTQPGGQGPGGAAAVTLAVGDYVMVIGNLIMEPNMNGSNAIHFAGWVPDAATGQVVDQTQTNGNGTTVFGKSQGSPPFCHTDPDANIPGDPCQMP